MPKDQTVKDVQNAMPIIVLMCVFLLLRFIIFHENFNKVLNSQKKKTTCYFNLFMWIKSNTFS